MKNGQPETIEEMIMLIDLEEQMDKAESEDNYLTTTPFDEEP